MTMIIFYGVMILIIVLLMIPYTFTFSFQLENTKIQYQIDSLFWKRKRVGGWKQKAKASGADSHQTNVSSKKHKKLFSVPVIFWLLQHVSYENIEIQEEVGGLMPYDTALLVPVVSALTLLPFSVIPLHIHKMEYHIVPNYEQLCLKIVIKGKAHFHISHLLFSIMQEKLSKKFL